ncbi:GNAT family N-acetyltransferase [Nocardia heshunensis]
MSPDTSSDLRETLEPPRFQPVPDPRPEDEVWPEMTWPVPEGTELRGETVELTPVDPAADAAELFRALDHDAAWSHVPKRYADEREFEDLLRQLNSLTDWQLWTVRTRREVAGVPAGAIVGVTAYLDVRARDAGLEIGFTVYTPAVWGTTVNPEAKLLLLGYAFDTLGVGRVQLKTDVRNQRSQQAIARLGAKYEGTLRRQFRREDGTLRDSVLFSIIAEEWPEVRDRLTRRLTPHAG